MCRGREPIVDRVVCAQKLCALPIVDRTLCVCMCASASVCPIMHPQLLLISKRKQPPSPLPASLWPRSTPVITSADGTPPQARRYAGGLAVGHIHKVSAADADVGGRSAEDVSMSIGTNDRVDGSGGSDHAQDITAHHTYIDIQVKPHQHE